MIVAGIEKDIICRERRLPRDTGPNHLGHVLGDDQHVGADNHGLVRTVADRKRLDKDCIMHAGRWFAPAVSKTGQGSAYRRGDGTRGPARLEPAERSTMGGKPAT